MLDSGDYIRLRPRLAEAARNRKPAGLHGAQAAALHAPEAPGLAEAGAAIIPRPHGPHPRGA